MELELSPGHALSFSAGQYVHVCHPSGRRIPFTIATAPHALPELEIHFQPQAGNVESGLMQELIAEGEFELEDVQGTVTLGALSRKNILYVCAGSGFAQAHAMLSSSINQQHPAERTLLWCADSPSGLYARDLLARIGHSIRTHLVVDPRRDRNNSAMLWLRDNAARIRSCDVILSGSPSFVYAATDILMVTGMPDHLLHSDVYQYAPR